MRKKGSKQNTSLIMESGYHIKSILERRCRLHNVWRILGATEDYFGNLDGLGFVLPLVDFSFNESIIFLRLRASV